MTQPARSPQSSTSSVRAARLDAARVAEAAVVVPPPAVAGDAVVEERAAVAAAVEEEAEEEEEAGAAALPHPSRRTLRAKASAGTVVPQSTGASSARSSQRRSKTRACEPSSKWTTATPGCSRVRENQPKEVDSGCSSAMSRRRRRPGHRLLRRWRHLTRVEVTPRSRTTEYLRRPALRRSRARPIPRLRL